MTHLNRLSLILAFFPLCLAAHTTDLKSAVGSLPPLPQEMKSAPKRDWLVQRMDQKTGVFRTGNENEVAMTNGLIRRTWRVVPNGATVAFDNLMTGASIMRGVKPEARVELDGQDYEVGGLAGQPDYAYLQPDWLDKMTASPDAFQCTGFEVGTTAERFPWKRVRHAADLPWPAPGASIVFHYAPPSGKLAGVVLSVHYEMYDGVPLLAKWFTLQNGSGKALALDTFTNEILAVVEAESVVDSREQWEGPNLYIESDYSFHGMDAMTGNRTTQWIADPQYTTQVNYELKSPVLMESRPPIGPGVTLAAGESFEAFRTFELVHDSTDRERRSLAQHRMYRTLCPWATENPILFHARNAKPAAARLAIDQTAEVGAEMVILSFGSGFNMEKESPEYIAEVKELVDYAHSKHVELGGYSLLASRKVSEEDDAINPATGKRGGAIFGDSPCLGSTWGGQYFEKITRFIEETGMDILEHDGSYPGDLCASEKHPGHKGLKDSQWTQWKKITDFYEWCRARGTYLNVPDWYFLTGSSKTGMGYREVNWSLPRDRQIILGRQNIYDGTWQKMPSMGWMFTPLVEYQGGGAEATLEPLSKHLDAYEAHLAQNFGSGVQSCYRGPRWYDKDETKAVVKKWITFYKKYRDILDSDLVHVRRADARDLDCMLHVNPWVKEKGLAMVYNPLDQAVEKTITLPLYYTGLADAAQIREQEGTAQECKLDRARRVELSVKIAAHGNTWFVIE